LDAAGATLNVLASALVDNQSIATKPVIAKTINFLFIVKPRIALSYLEKSTDVHYAP